MLKGGIPNPQMVRVLTEELNTVSSEMHKKILATLPKDVLVEYVPHVELKKQSQDAHAIIRTEEFTPYPSVISSF